MPPWKGRRWGGKWSAALGDRAAPAPPWNRRRWVGSKQRLFYAGVALGDCAAPRRRGTDGARWESGAGLKGVDF